MDRAGTHVTLDHMLDARDRRAARQRAALAHFAQPIVSVTVVMPGPVKDTFRSRAIFDAAVIALDRLFVDRQVHLFLPLAGPTGAEALYAVAADGLELKRAVVEIEETHPLGRLWDLDVIDPRQGILSRRDIGRSPRRCLLCDEPAHACARSRRHPLAEVLTAINETFDAYHADYAA
jgi:holo-ACP synthase